MAAREELGSLRRCSSGYAYAYLLRDRQAGRMVMEDGGISVYGL